MLGPEAFDTRPLVEHLQHAGGSTIEAFLIGWTTGCTCGTYVDVRYADAASAFRAETASAANLEDL